MTDHIKEIEELVAAGDIANSQDFRNKAANARPAIKALLDENKRMREALEKIANQICGNEDLSDDVKDFYRGYNAVVRKNRKIATEALKGEK